MREIGSFLLALSYCMLCSTSSNAIELREIPQNQSTHKSTQANDDKTPTIRIETAASGGSGVLVGRKGDTYTVITAYHVIEDSSLQEIDIVVNANTFKASKIIRPFPDVDIALIIFTSKEKLPVAFLPMLDLSYWSKIPSWDRIQVDGFANSSDAVKQITKRSSVGTIIAIASGNKDGYNLIHNAVTTVGMSGGGIFGYHTQSLNVLIDDVFNGKSKISYEPEQYFSILDKEKAEHDDWRSKKIETWDQSKHTDLQNTFFRFCMAKFDNSKADSQKEAAISLKGPTFSTSTKSSVTNQYAGLAFHASQEDDYKPDKSASNLTSRALKSSNYKVQKLADYFKDELSRLGTRGETYKQYWYEYDCFSLAHRVELVKSCTFGSIPYTLIGIHGRGEDYVYGGKSGYNLGILLSAEPVISWLKENQKQYGLNPDGEGARIGCRERFLFFQEK